MTHQDTHLYKINAQEDFFGTLAHRILNNIELNCKLQESIVIVPTKKSCFSLIEAFKKVNKYIPKICSINSLETLVKFDEKPVDNIKLLNDIMLMNIPEMNIDLAHYLINLINKIDAYQVDIDSILQIFDNELPLHKEKIFSILSHFLINWQSSPKLTHSAYNNLLIQKFINNINDKTVIIAGINSNLPLVGKLIDKVQTIKNGHIFTQYIPENSFEYKALSPANLCHDWCQYNYRPENIKYLLSSDHHQEAEGIINILKTHNYSNAMIVTPDEKLTIKLMLHLQANNMDANIIRDHPLKISKVAVWLQLCLNFIFKRADNLSILSLLKHPYADIDETKLIEMELLMREGSFSYLQLSSFLNDNDPIKHDLWSAKSAKFSSFLNLHISFAQSLSKEHLWDTYEGEKLKEYLDQCNNFAIYVSLKEYVEFFNYFLRSAYYRVEENIEAKITLAKPIDARLHKADLMILAGLNEGIWPGQMNIDPCFNRALLKKLKIVLPEAIIEEELYDFKNFIYAKNVILTRSEKIDGSSTVASRWLMKLLTLANDIKTIDYHRPRVESSSRTIYDLAIPPLHARPKQLSVTEIEKLIANPYQIYVDKILKLKKLPSLKNDLSQSDFGIFVHKALENYNKIRSEPDITILLSLAKKILPNNPHAQILWWPRFLRIAKWFVENQRSKYYSEIPGRYNIDKNFVITARADHIEMNDKNEVIIIDYKTGKLPAIKDINNGEAVQLLLAGIIAQNGKFICQNSDKQYKLVKLQYIQLNGSHKPIEILSIEESLSDLLLKAEENILNLIKNYYSQSTAYNYHKTDFSNYCIYQHLSRQFY